MGDFTEDDLVNPLIEYYDERGVFVIEPEAFYRDYGMRGCPDLYTEFYRAGDAILEAHIIEVKSESAVRQATGANEIVRQFNKARRYFFESDDRNPPHREFFYEDVVLVYELAFIPSSYTLAHILENSEIYNKAIQSSQNESTWLPPKEAQSKEGKLHEGIEVSMTFQHPKKAGYSIPLVAATGRRLEPRTTLPESAENIEWLKSVDTHLYNKMNVVLDSKLEE
jgi:hypothetical protein